VLVNGTTWITVGVASRMRCAVVTPRSTSCYDAGMSRVVTQRELRNDSGEIMRRLDAGESFVVTRNGVPVGELTPLRRLRFVTAESIAQIFQAAPPIDAEQFRRDLDAVAEQGIEPRG
jgi:prevent-host-death family protein